MDKYKVIMKYPDGSQWEFTEESELRAQVEADYFVDFCDMTLIGIYEL